MEKNRGDIFILVLVVCNQSGQVNL